MRSIGSVASHATVVHIQWLVAPLTSRFKARDLDSRTQNRLEITFALQRRRAARQPPHRNLSCASRHAYDETMRRCSPPQAPLTLKYSPPQAPLVV